MKSSSTRSGPSCSGFWDTVRNNLTIREMTALMGGDGTMEQQTEKDFRFENDPQAEVFLLSEKTKEKAPSISASCSLWCTSRDSSPGPTDQEGKPPVRLNLWKFRVIVIFNQGNVIFHLVISALFVGFCSEKYPLHVLKPCKIRAETVHLLSDKQNRPIPHRLDGIGLSGRTPKIKSRRILL